MSALGFDEEHLLLPNWLPAGGMLNTTRRPVKWLSVRNGCIKITIWDVAK
jgi:hypothetical protein